MANEQHLPIDDRHWHLDKRFNVGHFLTTLTFVGCMFIWATGVETRLVAHGEQLRAVVQQESFQTETLRRDIDRIQTSIGLLSVKLDQFIQSKHE